MTDRYVTSELAIGECTVSVYDAATELLGDLGLDHEIESTIAVTNTKPGEPDEEPRTYLVREIVVPAEDVELRTCTCAGFKYHCLPYADDVRDGEASLADIGRCKHGDHVHKQDRSTDARDVGQSGFDEYE